MANALQSARGRTWANILGIATSVVILGLAIWPGAPTASEEASRQLESAQTVWVLHGVGGLIALAGLVLGEITARTIFTLALPGLLLVLAAAALAPMPAPEEH